MSGGGGGPFRNRPPERLTQLVRSEEAKEFDAELSGVLNHLLAAANSRDVPLVQERLDNIKAHLQDEIEGRLDTVFGGSVAKHTWVDGLSDIDALLVINETKFQGQSPATILDSMEATLKERLPDARTVWHGD